MLVAGVDEAGRGPLAGPVVAAAAILLPSQIRILHAFGLTDSKKLSPRKRERLFALLCDLGVLWKAQAASPERIDDMNILQASLWCMKRSVRALPVPPDLVVVDGTVRIPGLDLPQRTLPKADERVLAVAAASVVAKVLRDRVLTVLDKVYPGWGFARHKGYPTAEHRRILEEKGLSPVHRRSFSWRMLP
ncbi:ribonuclease HII [Aminiphilus sp.]|jgi:ribonuclease HII|uniref:ribonuclease HII n=1 Tax=Aminiphilus sp. TaxID=1872488 RepID=UPI0026131E82|nr:ribonuclease HII [Aminiphilus sp.]